MVFDGDTAMPQVIALTKGRASKLGTVVEVRELTVEQWVARGDDAPTDGLSLLADMLYIDGVVVGKDRLNKLGINEVQGAMEALNTILGNDEDTSGNA